MQWECMFTVLAKMWAIKEEVLEPNASSNPLMAVISDNGTLERIRKKVVAQEAKVSRDTKLMNGSHYKSQFDPKNFDNFSAFVFSLK